jgi:hypothetical protein
MTKACRLVLKAGNLCDTEWAEPWLVTVDNGACPTNEDGSTEWYSCHEKIGYNASTRWWWSKRDDNVWGDVDGQVLEQGKYIVSFSVFNPSVGYPIALINDGGMGTAAFDETKYDSVRLDEGESHSWNVNGTIHTIKRLSDTDYKEFEFWVAVDKG